MAIEQRKFRADQHLWDSFGGAVDRSPDREAERSMVLRQFMRWYAGEEGARLPERPQPTPDTQETGTPGTVTLYETNSDVLVIAKGTQAWSIGNDPDADTFAVDAVAWVNGDWEPEEGDGIVATTTDGLTAVAELVDGGARLLIPRGQIGASARAYLGI